MTERICYLDALRGFSMILVVMGHTLFSINEGGYTCPLGTFITSIQMPLFFFISGFFCYKAIELWKFNYIVNFIKNRKSLVLAPIIFYAIYAYCISNRNAVGWLYLGFEEFWFTIALVQMNLIYIACVCIAKLTKSENVLNITIISLSLIFAALASVQHIDFTIYRILSWYGVSKFFQFFACGILVRKYFEEFTNLITSNWFKTISVLTYLLALLSLFSSFKSYHLPYLIIREEIVPFSGLIVVFLLFFLHREFFISNSKVAFFLKFIGMRTFDIYLLHWFFLPNKSALAQLSTLNGTFLFQAMNCFIISIIVILFCIIISQIVRISPILSSWIFGVKYRK